MVEKLSDGFYLITRLSLLKKAIAFLQKNFSWNDEKSIKIFNALTEASKKSTTNIDLKTLKNNFVISFDKKIRLRIER